MLQKQYDPMVYMTGDTGVENIYEKELASLGKRYSRILPIWRRFTG